MFMTIPTIMTWTRIFAIPLIVGVFYLPESVASGAEKNLVATLMFVVFAATDWLDGYLARKRARNPGSSCSVIDHLIPLRQETQPIVDPLHGFAGDLVGALRTIATGAPSRVVDLPGHYASVLRVAGSDLDEK